jgi:hypothetical protein
MEIDHINKELSLNLNSARFPVLQYLIYQCFPFIVMKYLDFYLKIPELTWTFVENFRSKLISENKIYLFEIHGLLNEIKALKTFGSKISRWKFK